MLNSLAESFSNGGGILLVTYMSQKRGYALCYLICAASCGLVLFAEVYEQNWLIPIAVILSKSSITCAFCLLYFTIVDYFESHFLGFVMGANNVFGRTSTIPAPIVAELNEPIPMMVCICLCSAAMVMSLRLEQPEKLKRAD